MGQYKVPQDVEAEDKILGPLTIKQFIYAIIGFAWGAVCFFIFRPIPGIGIPLMLIVGVPVVMLFLLLAFYRRDGQNFEQFLIALVGFFSQARRRVWRKEEVVESFHITPRAVTEEVSQRNPAEVRSQLERLGTMIDARGWNAPQAAGIGQLTMPQDDRLIMPGMAASAPQPEPDPLPASVEPMDAYGQAIATSSAPNFATQAAAEQTYTAPSLEATAAEASNQPMTAPALSQIVSSAAPSAPVGAAPVAPTSFEPPRLEAEPPVFAPQLSVAQPTPVVQAPAYSAAQPSALPNAPAMGRPGFMTAGTQAVAEADPLGPAGVPLMGAPAPVANSWDLGPLPQAAAVSAEEARQPDILDMAATPLGQNLSGMIQDAADEMREEALEHMQQATSQPEPAATAPAPKPHGPFVVPGLSTSVTKPVSAPILALATERDDLTVSQLAATAGRSLPLAEGATVELRNHA